MDVVGFRSRGPVWAAALLLGPLVAGGLVPLRGLVRPDHVVLGLVLVVALVAAAGRPPAGLVAAITTGLAYDVFWTRPYGSLRVVDGGDVATVVLLVLVGSAIEQLSRWGGRQRSAAAQRGGYLETLQRAANQDGAGVDAIQVVEQGVAAVLGADRARLVLDGPITRTVLQPDGSVIRSGRDWPVERAGLPVDDLIAIPVPLPGHPRAHVAVTAASRIARPTLEQRQVASLLARMTAGAMRA